MKLWASLARRSVAGLTQLAAVLALFALAVMAFSVLFPRPLYVVFAMSIGHVVGGAAFACYLLAVLLDIYRSPAATTSIPPGSRPSADGND